tara:strand:- start:821 stop:1309 length:489 start_codon:yes stop_codon:yes gene_type:complete
MFSSSYLWPKLGVGLIILLLMGLYSQNIGRDEDERAINRIKLCVTTPSKCIKQVLVMRVKIKEVSDLSVRVHVKVGRSYLAASPIKVHGLTGQKSPGRIIDVLGTFKEDGRFLVSRQREDDWIQTTKYVVSIFGVVVVLFVFFHFFKPTKGSFFPLSQRSEI